MKCPQCGAGIPENHVVCPVCGFILDSPPPAAKKNRFWWLTLRMSMTIGAILALFEIFLLAFGKAYSAPILVLGMGLFLIGYLAMRLAKIESD